MVPAQPSQKIINLGGIAAPTHLLKCTKF